MDNKRQEKRENIFQGIIPILCVIITAVLTTVGAYLMQDKREESFVKSLAGRFDRIESNMDLEQALDIAIEEKRDLEQIIVSTTDEKKQLEDQLDEMIDAEIYSPALVIDGLREETSIGKGIVDLDGNTYFSSDICARIWGKKPVFDKSKNIVYYSADNETIIENKVDLISEHVIYDGKYHKVYEPSGGETFSMGSDTFNKGFTIGADNYSLFGEGNGYALFDLKGKYSKLNVRVARVNRGDLGIEDAILKVYLNGEYKTEYALNGQTPPTSITIDLNYANDLKLEVCGSKIVYGFAECTLEK